MTRVTALGSGDAFGAAGRAHTSWLVRDSRGAALIDAGPSVLQGLHRAGVAPEGIAALHVTHLHGDHVAGWPFLLVDAVYRAKRTTPLEVTGPPGTAERLQTLWSACYADAAQRPLGFALTVSELEPGGAALSAGRRIEALRAQHMRPPHLALSLRVESDGGVLAFTGDTGAHPGLVLLAAGARALFAECSDFEAPPEGSPEPRAGADYPRAAGRRHLAWSELRSLLPGLGVRTVALAHLGAEARAARARIEAEAAALGLALTVCDDGTTLHL